MKLTMVGHQTRVPVLASGHESPVPVTALEDSDTDPDEIAHVITRAYHRHVEAYLATTYPPSTCGR